MREPSEPGYVSRKRDIRTTERTDRRKFFVMQFQITGRCNLRCRHCYNEDEPHYDMPLDQCMLVIDKFLTTMKKWGRTPYIWISGGEPTISPHFWDILAYLQDYVEDHLTPVHVAVLSNGSTTTKTLADRLEENRAVNYIQISVDGVSAETHDRIRGSGRFQEAIQAIRTLTLTSLEVHMHFVVHKGNYKDAFHIMTLAKELDVDVLTVTRLVPWGRGKEMLNTMLTSQETYALYRNLSDDLDSMAREAAPLIPKPVLTRSRCDWPVIYQDPADTSNHAKNGVSCGIGGNIGKNIINVMEDGSVYPCRRLPIPIGNILTQDIQDIWGHPLLWKLRRKSKHVKGKCQTCYFNTKAPYLCSGGASCISYGYYGDPFMPDPQCSVSPGRRSL